VQRAIDERHQQDRPTIAGISTLAEATVPSPGIEETPNRNSAKPVSQQHSDEIEGLRGLGLVLGNTDDASASATMPMAG